MKIQCGLAAAAIMTLGASGCATKGNIQAEVDALRQDMNDRHEELASRIEGASKTADAAMAQAEAAYMTAEDSRSLALGGYDLREVEENRVHFAFDSAELDPSARQALDGVAQTLTGRPVLQVSLLGYADPTGSDVYNLQLAERRAQAVMRYLNNHTPHQLNRYQALSYGEALPAGMTGSVADENRRVVVVTLLQPVDPADGDVEEMTMGGEPADQGRPLSP